MQSQMTEKDLLHDILVIEKDIVKTYGYSIVESSCPNMRTLLANNMKQAGADQFEIFTAMNKRGYYPTEDAPKAKVSQAKTQFADIQKQLH